MVGGIESNELSKSVFLKEVRMLHDGPCKLAKEAFCKVGEGTLKVKYIFLFICENMSSKKPCNSTCSVNQFSK